MSVLVSRRADCVEVSSREGVERFAMRILVIVGRDFPENGKRRKSKVSSAMLRQPRVSQTLSHILTEYDDGRQVNIPALYNLIQLIAFG